MIQAESYVLKKYIEKASSDYKKKYVSFLLPEEVQSLNSVDSFDLALEKNHIFSSQFFSYLHYSYFAEILSSFPTGEIPFYLEIFPEDVSKKIRSFLRISSKKKTCSPIIKEYFEQNLLKTLLEKNPGFLPPSYLPTSTLNVLIPFSKDDLCLLFVYLGLFDLAQILKKTVNSQILKKIDSYLSKEKKIFLQKIGYPQEPFLPSLTLANWSGSSLDLMKKIHKAGIVRFCIALSSENPLLIWYITHRLDTGRKDLIEELMQKSQTFLNAKFVMKQIHFVLQTNFRNPN